MDSHYSQRRLRDIQLGGLVMGNAAVEQTR
jgi:hypothetical protein